jgi:Gas vesicle protein K
MTRDKVLHGPSDLDAAVPRLDNVLSRRVNADPESVEKGLAQLVLTIVELLRQLMERQALRRIDAGGLTPEQEERLGATFMELSLRMEELREQFGLDEEDLNLNLGPLGNLL